MPTYDYRCRKCGHRYELFHRITDETPKRCPLCRGRSERVPAGGGGLLFKGSGFYITDYRSASYKEKARGEKGEARSADSKAGEGKPSGGKKPAAGPDSKPRSRGEKSSSGE